MMIKQQLESDIKQAMLSGDKVLVTTLRGLKSAILYAEVAGGQRDKGLPEDQIIQLLTKEAKKRQESADLYEQGGNNDKAAAERAEKKVIEGYLPQQLSDEELDGIVQTVIDSMGSISQQTMGEAIAAVREKVAGQADGGRIAAVVRSKIL